MERHLVVMHEFRPSLKTKFIRIHPKTWYSYIAMRVELYGCRLGEFLSSFFVLKSDLKIYKVEVNEIVGFNYVDLMSETSSELIITSLLVLVKPIISRTQSIFGQTNTHCVMSLKRTIPRLMFVYQYADV